jgi:hypothetical protein
MNQLSSNRQCLESKIAFLQQQLDSLEHYLPETYQYLMNEMDTQQRCLMKLKIQTFYQEQMTLAARKDDAPAAIQAAVTNVAG